MLRDFKYYHARYLGANGCYFIMTTTNCGLDFLWHNREEKTIEFWGPKANIEHAKSVISNRIHKHLSSSNTN